MIRTALVASLALIAGPRLLAVETFQPTDFGGSPIIIGAGARALGMGGAFVAVADDATANTWNPGGLTQLERPEFAATGGYSRREDHGQDTVTTDSFALDHASVVVPFQLGVPQTVALAWQRQLDFTKAVSFVQRESLPDEELVSRTQLEQEGSFAAWGLSYAIEPSPRLALGATVYLWDDDLTGASAYEQDFRRVVTDTITLPPDPPVTSVDDLQNHQRVEVDRGFSVVLGGLYRATPALTLGVVIKPRYRLETVQSTRSRQRTDDGFGGGGTDITTNTRSRSTLQMPTSVALGAAYRLGDLRTISVDVTWTRWRELLVRNGASEASPLHSQLEPDDQDDGIAVRAGYEHILLFSSFALVPRCGVLYEEIPGVGAVPSLAQATSVHAVTDRYYGVTVGLSAFQSNVLYDLAAQMRYGPDLGWQSGAPDEESDVLGFVVRGGVSYLF
ncbi:MAG: outer membrane protein transport protein [Planctomycetes bacterium]|nr:outer membrane protein transport protein [Planctomycetota bacterium]